MSDESLDPPFVGAPQEPPESFASWLAHLGARVSPSDLPRLLVGAFDQLPVAVLIAEAPSGRFLAANRHASEVWRAPVPACATIKHYVRWRGVRPDGRRYAPEEWPLARAILSGEVVHHEQVTVDREDGSTAVLDVSAAPIRREDGAVVAAVALYFDVTERHRAQEAEVEARRRLTLLHRVIARLGATLSVEEVVAAITEAAVGALGAATCWLYQLAPDGAALEHVGSHAVPSPIVQAYARVPLGAELPVADVVRLGAPLWLSDHQAIANACPAVASSEAFPAERLQSLGAIPLVLDGAPVGALVFTFSTPRAFEPAERELLVTLAAQAAQALHRARLLESERRVRERALWLQRIAAELSRSATVAGIVESAVTLCIEAAGASAGGLALLSPDGTTLRLAAPRGVPAEDRLRWSEFPCDRTTAAGEAVLDRTARFVESVEEYERRYPGTSARIAWRGGARVAVPLVVADQCLGALALGYPEWRRFDPEDRAFLRSIAVLCTEALERARRYEAEVAAREESLRRARELAEETRRKDEFLAMLAHELRNPLAPIVAAVELARQGAPRTAERHLAIVDRQARHLARLVDDLLDVARVTRGAVDLDQSRVDVAAIAARVVDECAATMPDRNLRLAVGPGATAVVGDEGRLTQVMTNLVHNACKHTPAGGVIDVAVDRQGNEVVVEVADTGAGIDPALLGRIFEPFVQGSVSLARENGGLGIGLAIARRLVELHAGTITARSDGPERGSRFTVRLPAAPAPAGLAAVEPVAAEQAAVGGSVVASGAAPAPLRVLVVEDNADAAEVMAELLGTLGHTVAVAADGKTALAEAGRLDPHVVLLDIGLPVLDGYEVARQLRASPSASRGPMIVAITGYAQPTDRSRSREVGIDLHMAKPPDLEELFTLLQRIGARVADGRPPRG